MGKIMNILGYELPDEACQHIPSQDPDEVAAWLGAPFAMLTSPACAYFGIGRDGFGGPTVKFTPGEVAVPILYTFYDRYAMHVVTRRDDSGGGYPIQDHMWESLVDHHGSCSEGACREDPLDLSNPPIPDETHTVVVDEVEQTWPKITRHGMRPWGEVSVVGKRLGRSMVAIVWPAPLREPLAIRMWPEGPDPRPPLVEADDAL